MMIDEVYTRTPVNGTAAKAVSQKGCSESLTDEQRRDNLVARTNAIRAEIKDMPTSPKRKALCRELSRFELEINAIRPKRKAPGVLQYFADVARETLTAPQFNSIMGKAVKRMNDAKEDN